MGKSCKVVVCGQAAVGKTAVLEQLLYANHVTGTYSVSLYDKPTCYLLDEQSFFNQERNSGPFRVFMLGLSNV